MRYACRSRPAATCRRHENCRLCNQYTNHARAREDGPVVRASAFSLCGVAVARVCWEIRVCTGASLALISCLVSVRCGSACSRSCMKCSCMLLYTVHTSYRISPRNTYFLRCIFCAALCLSVRTSRVWKSLTMRCTSNH